MSKDIQELLPFYVNGTLDSDEKALVEQAIKNTPSLKDEIAFLEQLRGEVKNIEFGSSPGELGLKRLQKSLAEERLKNDPIVRAQRKISKEQNWGWRAAAIAACLLLILQTLITTMPHKPGDLSAAGGPAITRTNGDIISVTFAPNAREENIRNLLLSINASIVDGPSALGVYKLSVSKDPAVALEKLRAHSTLIESAAAEGTR